MAHDVFISHCAKDKAVADAVCAKLEASGIRCWIAPRDILPGSDWSASIVNAISQSRALVLIFSASSNYSEQVKREVENAVSNAIPLLPMRIEDVAPSKSMRYFLGTQHWLDAITPPIEEHLDRLTETVRALLAQGSVADEEKREGSALENRN